MKLFSKTYRRGFTILEMLVVCAIILILVALVVAGSMRMAEAANRRNTNRTVMKLSLVLRGHWDAVVSQAQTESIPSNVLAMAGNNSARARVIYVKLRLRQEFPTSFAEALNPAPLPPLPTYQTALATAPVPSADIQAATCLWLTLKQQRSNVAFNPDTELSASEIGTLGPGLKYITDGWRGPVVLYRWPTGNTDFNPGDKPQPGTNDGGDPTGLLSDPAWFTAVDPITNQACWSEFAAVCHPVAAGMSYNLANPVVASPGPDGAFGLDPTMAVINVGATADNVYDYRLSIGK
jgi:prepilin-type N-terminal cleavage/methylation domain-containing protein